jgi:6-pyruvoyltetrahydropterin/6-carboxytetrahydropterin synthase
MKHSIVQAFTFHAAHHLPWHEGRCVNVHGHTYRVEIRLDGSLDERGIIVDFDELIPVISSSVIDLLDHSDLNDRFESPTAEVIATWVFEEARRHYPDVREVRLWETADSSAIVTRE